MEIDGSEMTEEMKEEAMRESLRVLSEMDFDLPPVGVSLLLHRRLSQFGIDQDPYKELKKISTNKALQASRDLEMLVERSDDRLVMASKIAIAGNVVDYGAANQLDLMDTLGNAIEKGMRIDDTALFKEALSNAKTLSYYLDNSGEVVADAILMKEIRKYNPDIIITAYAKKSPLLNDVTVEDCLDAGIDGIDGVLLKSLEEQGWANERDISENGGDIIISKGQGNYESLSDIKGIFFLLVVKCEIISKNLGADIGEMVFKKT
jgi:hypothetical protein